MSRLVAGDVLEFAPSTYVIGDVTLPPMSLVASQPGTVHLRGNIVFRDHGLVRGLALIGRININDQGKLEMDGCRLSNLAGNCVVARRYASVLLKKFRDPS